MEMVTVLPDSINFLCFRIWPQKYLKTFHIISKILAPPKYIAKHKIINKNNKTDANEYFITHFLSEPYVHQ